MSFPWNHKLSFFDSGECQVVMEKLDDLQRSGTTYTPARRDLFKALSSVKFEDVRVCIVGQDPYPGSRYATGIAFDIPEGEVVFPPTLIEIFKEYHRDLGYPIPKSGSLKKWVDQGVLLWNALPICISGKSLSCEHWPELPYLTKEIIEKLSQRALVFVFLGRVARQYEQYVNSVSSVICTSHPSPRGSLNSRTPFHGSRIFSSINAKLNENGLEPINWRLE